MDRISSLTHDHHKNLAFRRRCKRCVLLCNKKIPVLILCWKAVIIEALDFMYTNKVLIQSKLIPIFETSFQLRLELLYLTLGYWISSVMVWFMSQHMRFWYLSHREQRRLRCLSAVAPESSLFAHIKYRSRRRIRPKIRRVAPLDGCACMFEDWVYGGR